MLRKVVEHHDGSLSPADFFNSICGRDKKSAHSLISAGYVEEVPTTVHERSYTFYRATNKGRSIFDPIYWRLWATISGDVRTIIVASITSLVTTATALALSRLLG